VLDGDVDHGDASSFALMDVERDEGKTLPCSARPRSDVTIEAEIDIDEDLEMYPVEDYVGTLVSREHVARDTVRLVVDLDREIAFNAGQYEGRVPGARRPQGDLAAGARGGHPEGREQDVLPLAELDELDLGLRHPALDRPGADGLSDRLRRILGVDPGILGPLGIGGRTLGCRGLVTALAGAGSRGRRVGAR
jgi:hypothetical protein